MAISFVGPRCGHSLGNESQFQELERSEDTAPETSQHPGGKGKDKRQFQQYKPSPHPNPLPIPTYSEAWPAPFHSSEANKEAGPPATARTQERSKEMMFGKDKVGV